ncbi:MAG TPA: hypothetical protein VM840_06490 [Actinomycetota bacterium]|nr:hypothetical protein [Actinomycetota bacterium]
MAESSPARAEFSRGRLFVGLLLVLGLGSAATWALTGLRDPPSPGRLLYVTEGALWARELGSGQTRRVAAWPAGAGGPVASQREVAFHAGGEAWTTDLRTGETRAVATGRPVAFAPGGRLTVERGGVLVAGGRTLLPAGATLADGSPVWVSRSTIAVRLSGPGGEPVTATLLDVGAAPPSVAQDLGDARPLAASPDGAQLLLQRGFRLELHRVRDRRSEPIGPNGAFTRAAVSPSGVLAVAGTLADGREGIFSFGAPEEVVTIVPGEVADMSWTADGSSIVFVDPAGRVARVGAREPGSPRRIGVRADLGWVAVVP